MTGGIVERQRRHNQQKRENKSLFLRRGKGRQGAQNGLVRLFGSDRRTRHGTLHRCDYRIQPTKPRWDLKWNVTEVTSNAGRLATVLRCGKGDQGKKQKSSELAFAAPGW